MTPTWSTSTLGCKRTGFIENDLAQAERLYGKEVVVQSEPVPQTWETIHKLEGAGQDAVGFIPVHFANGFEPAEDTDMTWELYSHQDRSRQRIVKATAVSGCRPACMHIGIPESTNTICFVCRKLEIMYTLLEYPCASRLKFDVHMSLRVVSQF